MRAELRRFTYLLSPRERRGAVLLFIGMGLGAAFEVVGLGVIPLFVSLLSRPEVAFGYAPLQGVYRGLGISGARELVVWAAAALAALHLAKSGFLGALAYLQARYSFNLQVRISSRLFAAYLNAPYTFHLQRNSAQLLRNTNMEAQSVVEGVLLPVLRLTMEVLVLALVSILLFVVEPVISVLTVGGLAVIGLAFDLGVRKRTVDFGRDEQLYRGRMLQSVNQGLGGAKEARVLGRERYFVDAFLADAVSYARAARFRTVTAELPRLIFEGVAVTGMFLVAIVVLLQGRSIGTIIPMLTLLAVCAVRMIPSFNRIMQALTVLRYRRHSLDVVYEDLYTLERAERTAALAPSRAAVKPLRAAVQLVDLQYQYPGAAEPSLRGVTLEIPAGSAVAFVGPSGAGKTTLLDVLLGLLAPIGGEIRVDGVDIQADLRGWQQQIGYIPQNIYLSDETIRRNVAFGVPDSDVVEEDVWAAVASAQLADLVRDLPEGLDTVVGERGVRLSGGQRQRIGIARALYHRPRVIVMDEATSALDSETEREVVRALAELRRDHTIIVVAHRLSTVRNCDRLFVLKDGLLCGSGTYEQLLEESGEFQAIAS